MKKYFVWLICFLLLTGCVRTDSAPEKQLAAAQAVTAKWKDLCFSMAMTETGCEFTFDTPETLKVLTLVYDGDTMTAHCAGLDTEVPALFAAGILPLYRCVLACRMEAWEDVGEGLRQITLDGETFLMYYDPVGGTITRLEAKGAEGSDGYQILACIESE
jgi:hypothetical protein